MRRLSFGWILAGVWVAASCGGSNSGAPFDSSSAGTSAGFGEACDSDKDCSAFSLLCAPDLGCAECLDDDDCNRFESCLSGRCREVTSCDNSRDCDSDQVCDTDAGVCVACLVDADCLDAERCQAQLCVPVTECARSSDCPTSQVCDGDQGVCVDCVVDRDCVAGMSCVENACVPQAGGGGAPGQGEGGAPSSGGTDPGEGGVPGTGGTTAGTGGTPNGGMSGAGGKAGGGGTGGVGPDGCGFLTNTAPDVLEVEGAVPIMTGGQIQDGLYYMVARVDATGSCDCYHKNILLISGNGTFVEGWYDLNHFNANIVVSNTNLQFNNICPTATIGTVSPFTAGNDSLQIFDVSDEHVDYYEMQQ